MADISIFDPDPTFAISSTEREATLEISAGGEVITILFGSGSYPVDSLIDSLESLISDAREVITEIDDTPDEYDAFVSDARGGYSIGLEGKAKNTIYPRRDVAEYELAALMAEDGVFPAAWYSNDRGNYVNIGEDIRKYHDAGGDKLLPLPGVQYEPGDMVYVGPESYHFTVIKDYGTMGVWAYISGDPSIKEFIEDHSDIKPADDDDD